MKDVRALLTAATEGIDYTLEKDLAIDYLSTFKIGDGKTFNLDLNGKTLIATNNNFVVDAGTILNLSNGIVKGMNLESGRRCLVNNGTVTIEDVEFIQVYEDAGAAIVNNAGGDMIIQSATVNAKSITLWTEGQMVINDGTFIHTQKAGIQTYSVNNKNEGQLIVNNGEFVSNRGIFYTVEDAVTTVNNATLRIKDQVVVGHQIYVAGGVTKYHSIYVTFETENGLTGRRDICASRDNGVSCSNDLTGLIIDLAAITTVDDLIAAATNGGDFFIANDITIPTDKTVAVAANKTLNLNLNEKTLTVEGMNFKVVAEATLNLSNGSVKSVNTEAGRRCIDNYGTTTIENVSFTQVYDKMGAAIGNYAPGIMTLTNVQVESAMTAIWNDGGFLTINSGTYKMTNNADYVNNPDYPDNDYYSYAIRNMNGGIIIIEDGTFIANRGVISTVTNGQVIVKDGVLELNDAILSGHRIYTEGDGICHYDSETVQFTGTITDAKL